MLLFVLWCGCMALSLALCGSGFLHPESYSFLPHYLSGRPLLELIYDNHITDWGNYQARDPGFFFDWLDCQFIAWCVQRGHPHFFSATHYLMHLAAGFALWRIAVRYLGTGRFIALGLVLLLWTSPSAMLYSSFYRAAKVGLFLATLLVIWAWLAAREDRPGAPGWTRAVLFGVLAAALPMFDKQGFLFLGAFVCFLARNVFVRRSVRDQRLLISGLAALAFAWSYQRFLGPGITRHLLGYEVNRGYTSIPVAELLAHPAEIVKIAFGSPLLTLDSFRFALGALPAGLALIAGWWLWRQFASQPTAEPRWLGPGWCFCGLILFVVALYSAMLMLFPLMLSNEHRRFFYCLPVAALWLATAAAALGEGVRRFPAQRGWLELAVIALVAGNLFGLPEQRFVLRQGKYRSYVENATFVRNALRPENIAATGLTPVEAATLLPQTEYFRDAVPPSLREDRIFLALFSRHAPPAR